jgi:hypothetical protein
MNRKLTITVSEAVHEGVAPQDIEVSYREMAADDVREQEAQEWSEGLIADVSATDPHALR